MKKIMICSAKGGVGKTTVTVQLALSLTALGKKVAIVDADIDTPNLPVMLPSIENGVGTGEKIKPVIQDRIEMISLGHIARDTDFIMWTGERRAMAIQQLIDTVDWSSNIDYMLLDTPPGTGEEILYLTQEVKPDLTLVVSTPHQASIADVKRTISMLTNMGQNILGIIMNMAEIKCNKCGETIIKYNVPETIEGIQVIKEIPFIEETANNTMDKEVMKDIAEIIIEGR